MFEKAKKIIRHNAKTFLGSRPSLLFPLFRRRKAFDDLLVSEATDICIEGFPRSANSFAVGAFEYAQTEPVTIAHHTHVPANAMRACEWGIPTVVLVRSPYDAIVSVVALKKESQLVEEGVSEPAQLVSFRDWVHTWCTFYQTLNTFRNQACLVVAPFNLVIQDMGRVIKQVNSCFGTDFRLFEHTQENVNIVQSELGYHAGPNNRRKQLKENTRKDFDHALQTDSLLQRRMDTAKQLYTAYLESADVEVPTSYLQ
jgi:hypothetical protein